MRLHESLRDPDFSHSRLRGVHLHTSPEVEGKGGRESFFNTYKYTIEGIKCTPKIGVFFKKLVEEKPISIGNVACVLGTDAKRLNRWYKDYLSGFREAEREGRIGCDDIKIRREGGRKRKFFNQFPEIEEAYKYCQRIRKWYEPIRLRYSDRKCKIK